jgi:hypothetical protein
LALDTGGNYTPQLVVNGGWQSVGSDSGSIAREIAAARAVPALGRVSLQALPSKSGSRELLVKLGAQVLSPQPSGPFAVMLAIYESGLVSKIQGGENGGRELTYDYTVRKLIPAFELQKPGAKVEKEVRVDLDPLWLAGHLGVSAFIQDEASLRIIGAASENLAARN